MKSLRRQNILLLTKYITISLEVDFKDGCNCCPVSLIKWITGKLASCMTRDKSFSLFLSLLLQQCPALLTMAVHEDMREYREMVEQHHGIKPIENVTDHQ